jgi:hypothetical protein
MPEPTTLPLAPVTVWFIVTGQRTSSHTCVGEIPVLRIRPKIIDVINVSTFRQCLLEEDRLCVLVARVPGC